MSGVLKGPPIQERTFQFSIDVVRFCQQLDSKPGIARTLGRQLLRSGTSIGANIEEAQAAQSTPDFVNKCSIALKDARETIYWLRLLQATGQGPSAELSLLIPEADELSRIIGAIVVRTKKAQASK